MKPFPFIIVSGLIILALAVWYFTSRNAPGSAATTSAKIKIGFLVKLPEEPWFQQEWKFAEAAATQGGFTVIKIGTPDGEKVLAAIDNLAAQGAQGFVICTPDVRLGPAIVAKAKANQLKVLSVDDQFVGSDGKFMEVPHMGISARKIGNLVGETLAKELTQRAWPAAETAAMGITLAELDTARDRTDGARESLIAAGFAKDRIFIASVRGSAEVSTAIDTANIILTQHPEVKHWLVFGINDESVLGGVRALEGRGFTAEHIAGIGIGGTSAVQEWKKEKPTGFIGSVLLSPKRHGQETAELLVQWITKGTVPPAVTYTAGTLINRANQVQIMRDHGL